MELGKYTFGKKLVGIFVGILTNTLLVSVLVRIPIAYNGRKLVGILTVFLLKFSRNRTVEKFKFVFFRLFYSNLLKKRNFFRPISDCRTVGNQSQLTRQ